MHAGEDDDKIKETDAMTTTSFATENPHASCIVFDCELNLVVDIDRERYE